MEITNEILTGAAAVAEGTSTGEAGFRRVPRDPRLNARIDESLRTFERGLSGSLRGRADLAEALTTSDFPILLGAGMERELLAQYQDITPVWQGFASRTTVKDFKPKKLIDLFGGQAILPVVKEGTEFPARSVDETEYALKVGKRGARFAITWETIINDELDGLRDLPSRLATGARDTEDHVATSLLVNAAGPNTDFFKTANGNAPDNKPLTMDNLQAALTAISTRKDKENRPIVVSAAVLVVPPGLEIQARAILNATEIRTTVGDKTIVGQNFLRGVVTVVVNPWLPVIATDGKASARWFLLPAPSTARQALAVGFLRGHETPDLRVKADAGNSLGGGSLSPEDGSFEIDDIQYRVRHVLGGATLDPIATYVSNGS